MIDRETAQYIVDTVKGVCGKDINFIDERGIILASTDASRIDTFHEIGFQVVSGGVAREVTAEDHFFGVQAGVNLPVVYKGKVIAAVGISGDVQEVGKYALLATKITSILLRERELEAVEKRERSRIHYILMALIRQETADYEAIRAFLSEHGIVKSDRCRILLIQVYADAFSQYSELQNPVNQALERTGSRLYTFEYPGKYILLIRSRERKRAEAVLRKLAERYRDALAIGMSAEKPLSGIAGAYKEAEMAVQAADSAENFRMYEELGYEMLLGLLPRAAKKQYADKILEGISAEEVRLLDVYYGLDMSLQKTCEKLNMHKNTLQYKLNRIRSNCGKDPRVFRDAAALYAAVCIRRSESEGEKSGI